MTEDEARQRVIRSMCPEKVCRTCGEPSRRITAEFDPRRSALAAHIRERRLTLGLSHKDVDGLFPGNSVWLGHWESQASSQPQIPSPEKWPILKEGLGLSDDFDDLVLGERRWTESKVDYLTEDGKALALGERRVAYDRGGLPPVDASRVKAQRQAPDRFTDCGHDDWRPGKWLDPFENESGEVMLTLGNIDE